MAFGTALSCTSPYIASQFPSALLLKVDCNIVRNIFTHFLSCSMLDLISCFLLWSRCWAWLPRYKVEIYHLYRYRKFAHRWTRARQQLSRVTGVSIVFGIRRRFDCSRQLLSSFIIMQGGIVPCIVLYLSCFYPRERLQIRFAWNQCFSLLSDILQSQGSRLLALLRH